MARKPATLRLKQTIDLLAAYEAAGLGDVYNCRFIRDMASRLNQKKYPTKRQRDWLDNLIEEGIPAPKGDLEYIAKLDEAIATEGASSTNVLIDFRGKLVQGWELSIKQKQWCDALIEKAADIRSGSFWKPDATMTERIRLAVSCEPCYSSHYWVTHGGGAKVMGMAKRWLAGNLVVIDEWTVNKLFKTVSGSLRNLESPKFKAGDLGYVCDRSTKKKPGVIIAGPFPSRSGIVYDVLVEGQIITTAHINKRR